jgi:HEAT repeat protein
MARRAPFLRAATRIAAALVLATGFAHAEGEPWLEEVEAGADRDMLAGLLAEDEAARAAAAKRWEEERLAFHRTRRPGPMAGPRDEMDPQKPQHAFEARKVRITNGFVRALAEAPPLVRRAACRSIADLKPAFSHGREALGRAVDDDDPRVRAAAIKALAAIRPFEGGRHVEALATRIVERIADPDVEVRREAIWVGAYLLDSNVEHAVARAIEMLSTATADEDAEVRARALSALSRLSSAVATVARLRTGLDDAEESVRAAAARSLGALAGPHAPAGVTDAAPRLREMLGEKAFAVRWSVALALWEITQETKGLLPVTLEALETLQGLDLVHACRIVCRMGPEAVEAAPRLVALVGTVEHVRHLITGNEAHEALLSVGPTFEAVEAAVRARLAAESAEDRWHALSALHAVHGDGATIAALVHAHLAVEKDPRVRQFARGLLVDRAPEDPRTLAAFEGELDAWDLELLARLGPRVEPLVPRMLEVLSTQEHDAYRRHAFAAIGRTAAPSAVAALAARLDDPADGAHAMAALVEASSHAAPALDAVVEHLVPHTVEGARALAAMGEAARPALAKMERHLSVVPPEARPPLADAIRQSDGAAEPVVAALVTLLDHDQETVRAQAAAALGRWGHKAEAALPRLERMARDTQGFEDDGLAAAIATYLVGGDPKVAYDRCLYVVQHSHPPGEEGIRGFAVLGPHAAGAVPDLVRAALHWREEFWKQEDRTEAALEALARIGPAARDALPVIRSLARNRLFTAEAEAAVAAIAR